MTDDLQSEGRASVLKAPGAGVSKRSGAVEGRHCCRAGGPQKARSPGRMGEGDHQLWFYYAAAWEVCFQKQGKHM